MTEKITLTKKGKEKLEQELKKLKEVRRPAVIGRIKNAKDYGDLSENAEYADARDEQSFIEGRIQEIRYILRYATVVSSGKGNSKAGLGSIIIVEIEGEKFTYELADSTVADPTSGKISSSSPVGAAIMGKKTGDKVIAKTPSGEIELKIIKVE